MRRLKLTLAYDGHAWRGWQRLPGGDTIQGRIEQAVDKIAGVNARMHGSGRTDKGVHALGQVAHCDVPATLRLSAEDWIGALNAVMPLTIRVTGAEFVTSAFHSRFDAKGKIYRYRIWRALVMSPFEVGRAWHIFGDVDDAALRECAAMLPGTHNFARLSANRGNVTDEERREDPANTTRTLTSVEVTSEGDALIIEFEGGGFLYKMARIMAGTMIHVARGRDTVDWFRSLITDPSGDKSHHMAPADGLYLVRVLY